MTTCPCETQPTTFAQTKGTGAATDSKPSSGKSGSRTPPPKKIAAPTTKEAPAEKRSGGSDFEDKHPRDATGRFTYKEDSGKGDAKIGAKDGDATTGKPDGKVHGRISEAQSLLVKAGFLAKDAGRQGVAVDGYLGERTQKALAKYQKANGLKESGRLDAATLKKMGISSEKRSPAKTSRSQATAERKKKAAEVKAAREKKAAEAKAAREKKAAEAREKAAREAKAAEAKAAREAERARTKNRMAGDTDTVTIDSPNIEIQEVTEDRAVWSGPIGLEGFETGDGRLILSNALRWDTLPIPFRWAEQDFGEHHGAVVVGKITNIERLSFDEASERLVTSGRNPLPESMKDAVVAWGTGLYDLGSENGREAYRQLKEELTPGVSMDLDDTVIQEGKTPDSFTITEGRIRAATQVAIPAFEGARIAVSDPETFLAASGTVELNWVDDTGGLPSYIKRISQHLQKKGKTEGEAIAIAVNAVKKMCSTGDLNFPGAQTVNAASREEACAAVAEWEEKKARARASAGLSLVASAAVFDALWFENPRLKGPTPLTVTDEGRVFGHVATWGTCHIANPQGANVCTQPPRSKSNYAYFRTGAVSTTHGDVAVGTITMSTVHAGARLTSVDTMRHYEHTGTVGAFVAAGEDEYGIWVAGAAKPGADHTTLKAAPISGDWRAIGGSLEMVGALSVNIPGFPIPRAEALVAGGTVRSLVASGMVTKTDSWASRARRRSQARSLAAQVQKFALQERVRRFNLTLSGRQSFAYNEDQWRVPKGNGKRSGRWMDMPGIAVGRFDDYLSGSDLDDTELTNHVAEARSFSDEASDALKAGDGDGAVAAAKNAKAALAKADGRLTELKQDGSVEKADVPDIDTQFDSAKESVDAVADGDLSLLGDKGLGGDAPETDIGGEDESVVGDAPEAEDAPEGYTDVTAENGAALGGASAVYEDPDTGWMIAQRADDGKWEVITEEGSNGEIYDSAAEAKAEIDAAVEASAPPEADAPEADAPKAGDPIDPDTAWDTLNSLPEGSVISADVGEEEQVEFTKQGNDWVVTQSPIDELPVGTSSASDPEIVTAGGDAELFIKSRGGADAPDSSDDASEDNGSVSPGEEDAEVQNILDQLFEAGVDRDNGEDLRVEIEDALADGASPADIISAIGERDGYVPSAPAANAPEAPTGSAQQKAATKANDTYIALEDNLISIVDLGVISDEDAQRIGDPLVDLGAAMERLNKGVQDGNVSDADLKEVQNQLSLLEAQLMAVADKPGLTDEQAGQIGGWLDDLFSDIGELSGLLQGSMEPPPFATRKYVRKWLGRKGIRLDGRHSLI